MACFNLAKCGAKLRTEAQNNDLRRHFEIASVRSRSPLNTSTGCYTTPQCLEKNVDQKNRLDREAARRSHGCLAVALSIFLLWTGAGESVAGVIFGFTSSGLDGGSRWDAAPRNFNLSGTNYERSLSGGLRYSLQGGSYQAYRDMFSWSGGAPSVAAFQTAVEQAFAAWTVPDPVSLFTTQVSFVADLNTPVVGIAGGGAADSRGAEIDLFAATDAGFWDPGNNSTQGETNFNAPGGTGPLTLTSGTAGYGGFAISGADIIINSNPGAVYTLDLFRRLLTHEIGHAIGLGDVEGSINPGRFIDDNFNGASSATAPATLTNSWTSLVNALNPALSALSRYTVPFADPGTTTTGVDILMESKGLGIATGNPLGNLTPMTNDDYGTRQFLYPSIIRVPEPTSLALAVVGVALALFHRLRRRRQSGDEQFAIETTATYGCVSVT